MKRNPCKECPHFSNTKYSTRFKMYIKKMSNFGKIEDNHHACHMITNDIWGYKTDINSSNVCVGSCKSSIND